MKISSGKFYYANRFGVVLASKKGRNDFEFFALSRNVRKRDLATIDTNTLIPVPTLEDVELGLRESVRSEEAKTIFPREVEKLLVSNDMESIGRGLKYAQAALDVSGSEVFQNYAAHAIEMFATIRAYRQVEQEGGLPQLRSLIRRNRSSEEYKELLNPYYKEIQARLDVLRDEVLAEQEAAAHAPEVTETAGEAEAQEAEGSPIEVSKDRSVRDEPEAPTKSARPKVDIDEQIRIIEGMIERAKVVALVTIPHNEAVDSIATLHKEGNIRFRTAVILLNHVFAHKTDPQETVDLINANNPPAKGPIEISNLRKQLAAAIQDVSQNGEGHSDLLKQVSDINPKRVKFTQPSA